MPADANLPIRSDTNKQLLRLLQDILTSLLDESNALPDGLLEEVLLAQILAHKEVCWFVVVKGES